MFSFSWSEIALIVAVALIAIGPKDLPAALKATAQVIKKARGMAGEFQGHMNDLLREADLEDVRTQINEIRNFDFKGAVEKAIDPDNSIRDTFNEDPFAAADAAKAPVVDGEAEPVGETAVLERPAETTEVPALPDGAGGLGMDVPPFVPPAVALAVMRPPAFVPPELLSTRS